ncbi:metallophosphoesterase [Epidermidibacterium keratini]|uniref:Metallophosphoesterase n=1 Tax=Epidermidibacterium keratini TaxID=1891644 RepID=A0A7L4YJS3_9ACTN|nr:metallophosphoesterase [Epidermidibacterium keratini]QHB99359.1 metallophosphoesterase [Epidermidibacterium keratini]
MNWFVIVALGLILALHGVIFWRLAVVPGWPKRVQIAIGVAIAVLAVLFVSAWRSLWAPLLSPDAARPLAWVGMTWLAFGLYLFLGLLVFWIASGVVALRGRERTPGPRRRLSRIGALTSLAVASAATTWGIIEARSPSVTTWTTASDELPQEFDGIRVALLSDLHTGAVLSDTFIADVVAQTNEQDPDIVVLAGDIGEGDPDRYGTQLAALADLEAPLGVYAVTGNHEFVSGEPAGWMDKWEEYGVTVLGNISQPIERDGASIQIAGVHDESGEAPYATDHDAALEATSPDDYILYVAHQPVQAEDVAGRGIDVQVSGHTHGGQFWPMQGLVLLAQPRLDGYGDVGDVPVLTSRGAGSWGPPVRVGAPPEIPILTLSRL